MPTQTVSTTEAIIYKITNLGIHTIDIQDGSRVAITSLVSILEKLYTDTKPSRGHYLMIDSSTHALPMTPTIRQVVQLERNYPNHIPLNIAILLNLDIAIMVDTMLTPLRGKNQIRLFTLKDSERAMQWLLSRQAINGVKADAK